MLLSLMEASSSSMALHLIPKPNPTRSIAYFSMEVGLESSMPTYSGGLGVLAGDTLKAAADLSIPMVGVTLLHRKGYFRQYLDDQGGQSERPFEWDPKDFLEPLVPVVTIPVEGRPVRIQAWHFKVKSPSGHHIHVYFLDSDVRGNTEWDAVSPTYSTEEMTATVCVRKQSWG